MGPRSLPGGTIVRELIERGARRMQRLEFNASGHLRITRDRDDRIGLILRDGGIYFFGSIGETPVVVDLLVAAPKAPAAPQLRDDALPFRATGRLAMQAGVDGEWHCPAACGEDVTEDDILITRDPRLAPLMRTLAAARAEDVGFARWLLPGDSLLQQGGLVLIGASACVTTICFDAVDDARFGLPAAPVADPRTMFRAVLASARGRIALSVADPALR